MICIMIVVILLIAIAIVVVYEVYPENKEEDTTREYSITKREFKSKRVEYIVSFKYKDGTERLFVNTYKTKDAAIRAINDFEFTDTVEEYKLK